jgi:hypothetical protein
VRLHDRIGKQRELRNHWQRACKLILAKENVLTVSRALELALFHDAKLDLSKVPAERKPRSQRVWGCHATGAGFGLHVQASWSVCARSGFDNGAILRFPYCDISAMTLLRQHINQHFSVSSTALARIQPETERTLAFA